MWEDLRKEFVDMDPYGTGYVSKEEFRDVLTELCVHLSEYELNLLTRKFEIGADGRSVYFLKIILARFTGEWVTQLCQNECKKYFYTKHLCIITNQHTLSIQTQVGGVQ